MSGKTYFNENTPKVVIQSLFRKYDQDGNGVLQKHEMMSLLVDDLGLDTKKSENVLMEVDKDGDGNVTFEEFFQWLRDNKSQDKINESGAKASPSDDVNDSQHYKSQYTKKAVEYFKKYDQDNNGFIDAEELKLLLKDLNYQHSVEVALEYMDADGDGTVSFPEFLKWLNWVPEEDE